MCGRYLIEEEAYSDILEILYRSGTLSPIVHSPAGGLLPFALKDAMASTMLGTVSETVSGEMQTLFPGTADFIVTNGEVFPTNTAPVLTNGSDGIMVLKWGFPHWKNNDVIINARAETALEKKMFRQSLLERRCVIPSNGFYEWGNAAIDGAGTKSIEDIQIKLSGSHEDSSYTHSRRKKTKYLLRHPSDTKLYMAGFWSAPSCAFIILTTAANESVAPLHNRMPVILSPDEIDDWLGDISFMEYALHRPGPELEITAA